MLALRMHMSVGHLGPTNGLGEAKSKLVTFLFWEKIHSLAVNESLFLTSLPKACLCRSVCRLNDMFLFHRLCRKILCASLKHYQPDVEWRGRCCPGYLPLSVQGHCPHPPPCSTASRLTLADYTYSLSCFLVLSWIWPMGRHPSL